MEASAFSQAN